MKILCDTLDGKHFCKGVAKNFYSCYFGCNRRYSHSATGAFATCSKHTFGEDDLVQTSATVLTRDEFIVTLLMES